MSQKITASLDFGLGISECAEIPNPKSNGVRVKMCGKSAQRSDANRRADKPCGLKCHVHREGATSVVSLYCSYSAGGRQIHFVGDGESR